MDYHAAVRCAIGDVVLDLRDDNAHDLNFVCCSQEALENGDEIFVREITERMRERIRVAAENSESKLGQRGFSRAACRAYPLPNTFPIGIAFRFTDSDISAGIIADGACRKASCAYIGADGHPHCSCGGLHRREAPTSTSHKVYASTKTRFDGSEPECVELEYLMKALDSVVNALVVETGATAEKCCRALSGHVFKWIINAETPKAAPTSNTEPRPSSDTGSRKRIIDSVPDESDDVHLEDMFASSQCKRRIVGSPKRKRKRYIKDSDLFAVLARPLRCFSGEVAVVPVILPRKLSSKMKASCQASDCDECLSSAQCRHARYVAARHPVSMGENLPSIKIGGRSSPLDSLVVANGEAEQVSDDDDGNHSNDSSDCFSEGITGNYGHAECDGEVDAAESTRQRLGAGRILAHSTARLPLFECKSAPRSDAEQMTVAREGKHIVIGPPTCCPHCGEALRQEDELAAPKGGLIHLSGLTAHFECRGSLCYSVVCTASAEARSSAAGRPVFCDGREYNIFVFNVHTALSHDVAFRMVLSTSARAHTMSSVISEYRQYVTHHGPKTVSEGVEMPPKPRSRKTLMKALQAFEGTLIADRAQAKMAFTCPTCMPNGDEPLYVGGDGIVAGHAGAPARAVMACFEPSLGGGESASSGPSSYLLPVRACEILRGLLRTCSRVPKKLPHTSFRLSKNDAGSPQLALVASIISSQAFLATLQCQQMLRSACELSPTIAFILESGRDKRAQAFLFSTFNEDVLAATLAKALAVLPAAEAVKDAAVTAAKRDIDSGCKKFLEIVSSVAASSVCKASLGVKEPLSLNSPVEAKHVAEAAISMLLASSIQLFNQNELVAVSNLAEMLQDDSDASAAALDAAILAPPPLRKRCNVSCDVVSVVSRLQPLRRLIDVGRACRQKASAAGRELTSACDCCLHRTLKTLGAVLFDHAECATSHWRFFAPEFVADNMAGSTGSGKKDTAADKAARAYYTRYSGRDVPPEHRREILEQRMREDYPDTQTWDYAIGSAVYAPGLLQVRPYPFKPADKCPAGSAGCRKHHSSTKRFSDGLFTIVCGCKHPCLLLVAYLGAPETRRVPTSLILGHFANIPRAVIYDDTCNSFRSMAGSLSWALTETYLSTDAFHAVGHACESVFKSFAHRDLISFNTSAPEQKNVAIANMRPAFRSSSPDTYNCSVRVQATVLNVIAQARAANDLLHPDERVAKEDVNFVKYYFDTYLNGECPCERCHEFEKSEGGDLNCSPAALYPLAPRAESGDLEVGSNLEAITPQPVGLEGLQVLPAPFTTARSARKDASADERSETLRNEPFSAGSGLESSEEIAAVDKPASDSGFSFNYYDDAKERGKFIDEEVKANIIGAVDDVTVVNESSAFSDLTQNALRTVRRLLTHCTLSPTSEVAVSDADPEMQLSLVKNIPIVLKDFGRLLPGAWLNDELINVYMALIVNRSAAAALIREDVCGTRPGMRGPTAHAVSSYFYDSLCKDGTFNYKRVQRWTRYIDLRTAELIFVPVNKENLHWVLVVLNLREKTVNYYDSLGGVDPVVCRVMMQRLQQEWHSKLGEVLDIASWTILQHGKNVPQQANSDDCGVFVCKFADFIERGAVLNFSATHIEYFRARMAHEFLAKRLA